MGDNGADLISELPDELLLHIFSFLDDMVLVRSSVLSRRWRYLWTLISFPTKMKKDRLSYMVARKMRHQYKLTHEQLTKKQVYNLSISITETIPREYLLSSLPFFFMLEFKYFACFNIVATLLYMGLIWSDWHWSYSSSLGFSEASLKELQKIEFRSIPQINSISIFSPMMKPLLLENFQPKIGVTKSNVLFGMLAVMIISCSLTILNWKFELGTKVRVYDYVHVYDYVYDFLVQYSLTKK